MDAAGQRQFWGRSRNKRLRKWRRRKKMGKIEQNKQNKFQRLMESAFELFTSHGISDTSIAEIARRAGTGKGTFYLYFRDKYDLQQKLIAHKASQLIEHALEHSGYENFCSPQDRILALIDDIIDQFRQNKSLLRFIDKRLGWGVFTSAITKADSDTLSRFMQVIPSGISEKDREIVIFTIVELIGSTCHDIILEEKPVSLEEYRPYLHKSVRAVMNAFTKEACTDHRDEN